MDAIARFTMFDGDLELVDDSVEKYNPNHDDRGRFAGGSGGFGGSADLHRNLQNHLDGVSAKIDALPPHPAIQSNVAQAKISIHSASRATTPLASANALSNADLNLANAARKVTGTNTPLAIRLADISKDVRRLGEALRRP